MKLHKKGLVDVADHLHEKADTSIQEGLENVGMYHAQRPLTKKDNQIIINDTHTLYYYHNRLEGYELENYI